jgi:hypothetical protein
LNGIGNVLMIPGGVLGRPRDLGFVSQGI